MFIKTQAHVTIQEKEKSVSEYREILLNTDHIKRILPSGLGENIITVVMTSDAPNQNVIIKDNYETFMKLNEKL